MGLTLGQVEALQMVLLDLQVDTKNIEIKLPR